MKKVLITGADSYIGTSFERYVKQHYNDRLSVTTIDMIDGSWRQKDFSPYDVVFHVAGLAHADVGNVDQATKDRYYSVNTDLAIETAKKAKRDGVKQFVFMSSMIIYGKQTHITKTTRPHPANFYGDSKWKADQGVRKLADDAFTVTVLRPPMIYGKGSKGNYPLLSRIARKTPVFPAYENRRSMLYIENLCEFLAQVMLRCMGGIFWPQNGEYSSTCSVIKEIAKVVKKRMIITKLLNPPVVLAKKCPVRRIRELSSKAFGDSWYESCMSVYEGVEYQKVSLRESICRTEV